MTSCTLVQNYSLQKACTHWQRFKALSRFELTGVLSGLQMSKQERQVLGHCSLVHCSMAVGTCKRGVILLILMISVPEQFVSAFIAIVFTV